MPCCARPTVRNCTSGGSSGSVPVMVGLSVIAYLTIIGKPSRLAISSTTSGLIGADADVPMRTCDRSTPSTSGSRSSRSHWVGTAPNTVTRSSATSRTMSAGGRPGAQITSVMPFSSWSHSLPM